MAGLNIEFPSANFSIANHENDGVRHYRTYEITISPETTVFLNTTEDVNGGPEHFAGLCPNEKCASDPELPSIRMKGYVGAHERDGVLSLGTPWHAASIELMRLAKEAAKSGNAFLVVDEDEKGEIEGEERRTLYGVLRDLRSEAGAPVIEEDGQLTPYVIDDWEDPNLQAEEAKSLLREKTEKAFIPEEQPAPGAPSWRECWREYFLGNLRAVPQDMAPTASASVMFWNEHEEVARARLDEAMEELTWIRNSKETILRTGPNTFVVEDTLADLTSDEVTVFGDRMEVGGKTFGFDAGGLHSLFRHLRTESAMSC